MDAVWWRLHLRQRVPRLGERVLHDILAIEDGASHACAVAVQLRTNIGHEIQELRACFRAGGEDSLDASVRRV